MATTSRASLALIECTLPGSATCATAAALPFVAARGSQSRRVLQMGAVLMGGG
jgi:hypothetical protein